MIILACETSTLLGSVAVLENQKLLASEQSFRQGSHSDVLNLFIEKALAAAGKKLSDIELFVSGVGPGSFTGIRISVNTIKTLAYCQQKQVLGINSLHTLAQQNIFQEFSYLPVISMINAYKNMVYIAKYKAVNGKAFEVSAPEVLRVQQLSQYITEKALVCGDGFQVYSKYFSEELSQKIFRPEQVSDEPHASVLGQLAMDSGLPPIPWNQLLPVYLRASEAEENLLGIKYQPLN